MLEEECNNNADAINAIYSFNKDDRWKKSNRGDGFISVEVNIDTSAALPFYKNLTVTSTLRS